MFSSPRPINGGEDCVGVNFEFQLCNTEECPKHFEDFRAQQCQQRNSHFEFQNSKHHWLPYEHPDCKFCYLCLLQVSAGISQILWGGLVSFAM